MSAYNLFSQLMFYFYRYSMCFIVFIPRQVTTSFDRFFAVFCHSGPRFLHSEAGIRTETGPDFKALDLFVLPEFF